jgi:putative transposase
MTRPLRIQYPGAVYHVTCRGNERGNIFRDDEDRHAFLRTLSQSLDIYSVKLHAYVLMDNHFHLLAETPLGNLSEFMRHLNITYTSRFNRRHNRAGHLYQGRYKSILVEKEAYLSALSRYIHLNPIKVKKLADHSAKEHEGYLISYSWSSLPGYIDPSRRETMVDYTLVLSDYGGDTVKGRNAYRRRIKADITAGLAVKEGVIGQSILGGEDFIQWVHDAFLGDRENHEQPSASEKCGIRKKKLYWRYWKKRREKTLTPCGEKKETSGAWQWTCCIVTEA